jgi:hypothetical protein
VLRESQADREKFARTSLLRLEQQQVGLLAQLDREYEDRLADRIPEELWTAKSAELQRVRGDKVFDRYKDGGVQAFTDRSRRAYRQANRLPAPGSVPSSGGILLAPSVSCDRYPIAAKISCVVVDSNGVVGSFIDSALK